MWLLSQNKELLANVKNARVICWKELKIYEVE